MQDDFFTIFLAFMFAFLLANYAISVFKKNRWLNSREEVSIIPSMKEIAKKYGEERVLERWNYLAYQMSLDPKKLRKSDTISDIIKLYPFHDIKYDDIETFLEKYISEIPNEVKVTAETSLGEIIEISFIVEDKVIS